jgi:hypothetical protein
MSFSEILMKLAEKKALEGDVSMAYSLMSEAEEKDEKDESLAEMIKRGKDTKKTSALELMIKKYASKGGKGSYKDKIKSMDGFMKMDGKAFCFTNNAQAKKALAVAEQAANFLNWQVMKGDGCFKLMEVGMDKKANVLEQMIHKYAGDLDEIGMSKQNEPDDQELFDFLKKNPGYFDDLLKPKKEYDEPDDQELFDFLKKNPGYFDDLLKPKKEYDEPDDQELFEKLRINPDLLKNPRFSSLKDLIKKYAKEDWEITSEEFYEPPANTDVDPLKFDDVFDAMGRGFEDGMRHPDDKKNPYNPVEHDDDLFNAYENGFESALDQHTRNMSRGM